MFSEQRFSEILAGFRAGIESNRLAHGYLIVGAPRGAGLDLARGILQTIFCSETARPCGKCKGCRGVREQTHPDIMWVEPQKKSQQILVDQVREVQHRMSQTAFTGQWKACVMIGADRLGEEAANAFLKTLEEPPGRALFLLLTDSPQSILPTVLSRCQRVTLSGEQGGLPEELASQLRAILMEPDAGGLTHLWKARQMMAFLKAARKAIEEEEGRRASDGDAEETVDARINARYKEMRTLALRAVLIWHRDILLLSAGAPPALLANGDPESLAVLRERAARTPPAVALRHVEAVERMQQQLNQNLSESMVFPAGFSTLSSLH